MRVDWMSIAVLALLALSVVAVATVGFGMAQYVVLLAVVLAILRGQRE